MKTSLCVVCVALLLFFVVDADSCSDRDGSNCNYCTSDYCDWCPTDLKCHSKGSLFGCSGTEVTSPDQCPVSCCDGAYDCAYCADRGSCTVVYEIINGVTKALCVNNGEPFIFDHTGSCTTDQSTYYCGQYPGACQELALEYTVATTSSCGDMKIDVNKFTEWARCYNEKVATQGDSTTCEKCWELVQHPFNQKVCPLDASVCDDALFCGSTPGPNPTPSPYPPNPTPSQSSDSHSHALAYISVAVAVVLIALLVMFCLPRRQKKYKAGDYNALNEHLNDSEEQNNYNDHLNEEQNNYNDLPVAVAVSVN